MCRSTFLRGGPAQQIMAGMTTNLSLMAVGVLGSFFLSGCGSSSGGNCANSAACGGDIVGTWKITSTCLSANAVMGDSTCPTSTVSASHVTIIGSTTYDADMTYTQTGKLNGMATVVFPASCLTLQGLTLTCDQLNQTFQMNPTPGISIHCTGSSSCSCDETLSDFDSSEAGTYTTTPAGVLTETPTGGTATVSDYCAKGTTLTESPHSGSAMMGQPLSGTITFTKS